MRPYCSGRLVGGASGGFEALQDSHGSWLRYQKEELEAGVVYVCWEALNLLVCKAGMAEPETRRRKEERREARRQKAAAKAAARAAKKKWEEEAAKARKALETRRKHKRNDNKKEKEGGRP